MHATVIKMPQLTWVPFGCGASRMGISFIHKGMRLFLSREEGGGGRKVLLTTHVKIIFTFQCQTILQTELKNGTEVSRLSCTWGLDTAWGSIASHETTLALTFLAWCAWFCEADILGSLFTHYRKHKLGRGSPCCVSSPGVQQSQSESGRM